MKRFLCCLLFPLLLSAAAAASPLEGRWRLDKARSSALDGWHEWDLVIGITGRQVRLRHDMKWGRTEYSATNVVDLAAPATVPGFFRVEQRHMALYPAKGAAAEVNASWLDGQRTLRVEAEVPIEISQGQAMMRIYAEYRLLEGDNELLLIELHSTRPRPLVYRFTKVSPEN
jgi:hypothetical protein